MEQKKDYMAPDFEIEKFEIEEICCGSGVHSIAPVIDQVSS